jgi:hypothetical protein
LIAAAEKHGKRGSQYPKHKPPSGRRSLNNERKLMRNLIQLVFVLFLIGCAGTKTAYLKEVPLSEVKFQSIFGQTPNDSSIMYCLLGMGYFRAPSSDSADSMISNWIISHPSAILIPVYSQPLKPPNSMFLYVIAVDNQDTLNYYLIKNGCFPGGTMQRAQKWSEMSSKERKNFGKGYEEITVYMADPKYKNYLNQIIDAEKYAHDKQLGIWKKGAQ